MKRFFSMVAVVVGASLTLGVIAYGLINASKADVMMGVVATAEAASLEVEDQSAVAGSISVARVTAPGPSWIVVHLDMDGKPGKRVGLQHVSEGTSSDVAVQLDPSIERTPKLLVAVHADRGVVDRFEFKMDNFDASPDKPYFVDGMELAMAVGVE